MSGINMGDVKTENDWEGAVASDASDDAAKHSELPFLDEILMLQEEILNMESDAQTNDHQIVKSKEEWEMKTEGCSPIQEAVASTVLQVNLETNKASKMEYKCSSCDLTFNTTHMLLEHTKSHHGNEYQEQQFSNKLPHKTEYVKATKEFKCSHCNYETAYRENLRIHERTHAGGKPFPCKHCDLVFNKRTHLFRHEIKHNTDIKEFKCKICNFASAYKQNLRVHETIHTGEKPYKCAQCDFATRIRESLTMHERTHTGALFKCSSCDYTSLNKRRLEVHEWKHTGEKPYKCKLCDFKTARVSSLKPHMISRHHNKT